MAEAVCIDSGRAINTLSLAEPSYHCLPCGVQVDMDTVNIAGSTLPTVLKVQPCVISGLDCIFSILHINLTAKKLKRVLYVLFSHSHLVCPLVQLINSRVSTLAVFLYLKEFTLI